MREKTRQMLLASGRGITLKNARTLMSDYTTYSGCLSGSGWAGIVFKVGDVMLPARKVHVQNNAPTGWERRGTFSSNESGYVPKRGDVISWVGRGNLLQYPAALDAVEKFFGGWRAKESRIVV